MKTFKVSQKLKQVTYAYIVCQLLTKDERKPLARLFCDMNGQQDGRLSNEDVEKAFKTYFENTLDDHEIQKMFSLIDMSGSG
jgi:Ca2+-binding EF-hand superfamily protein